jgi:hypothetical protein
VENKNLLQQIISFTAQETLSDIDSISLKTRLLEDLGIDGEDGEEFLMRFSREFEVDLSNLTYEKHFGAEAGSNPITLGFYFTFVFFKNLFNPNIGDGKADKLISITIEDLVHAAEAGYWLMNYDNS